MRSAAFKTSVIPICSLRLLRIHPIRAALTWAAFHVFLAFSTGGISTFGFRGALFMAAAAATVSFVDSRWRRETVMLGNLGVPVYVVPLIAAGSVLVLEMLLSLTVQ